MAIGSSALIGTFLGILAAHVRGWVDQVLALATDFLLVFPTLVMSLMLVVAIGQGVKNVTMAISLRVAGGVRVLGSLDLAATVAVCTAAPMTQFTA